MLFFQLLLIILVSAALVLHLDVPFELRAQRSVELYGSFGAEASKGLGTSKGSYSEVSENDGSRRHKQKNQKQFGVRNGD